MSKNIKSDSDPSYGLGDLSENLLDIPDDLLFNKYSDSPPSLGLQLKDLIKLSFNLGIKYIYRIVLVYLTNLLTCFVFPLALYFLIL